MQQRAAYDVPYRCVGVERPFVATLRRLCATFGRKSSSGKSTKRNLLTATLIAKRYRCKFVFHISHVSDTKRWIAVGTRIFNGVDPDAPLPQRLMQTIKYLQWPVRSAWNYNSYYLIDGAISTQADLGTQDSGAIERTIYMAFPRMQRRCRGRVRLFCGPHEFNARKIQKRILFGAAIGVKRHRLFDGRRNSGRSVRFLHDSSQLPANFHYLGLLEPEQVNGLLDNALFWCIRAIRRIRFDLRAGMAVWQPTVSLYHDPEGLIGKHRFGF